MSKKQTNLDFDKILFFFIMFERAAHGQNKIILILIEKILDLLVIISVP